MPVACGIGVLLADQWSKRIVQVHEANLNLGWGSVVRFRFVPHSNRSYEQPGSRAVLVLMWVVALLCAVVLNRFGTWFHGAISLAGLGRYVRRRGEQPLGHSAAPPCGRLHRSRLVAGVQSRRRGDPRGFSCCFPRLAKESGMRRVLFRWRGLTVWSYPAMLYFGLVAGDVAGNLAAHVTGADAFRVFVATLILIPPAIAGARLLYVGAHWKQYRDSPGRIWNQQEGGMAMYGGMPVMLLLSVPVLAALGLGFGEFWDVAALTILTGMVFTKMGCLLNGCCAGRPSQSPHRR